MSIFRHLCKATHCRKSIAAPAAQGRNESRSAKLYHQANLAGDFDPVLCDVHHLRPDPLSAKLVCADHGHSALAGSGRKAL